MPWHVARSVNCPAAKPWAVIKNADGQVVGCHVNRDAANAQMAALYASEPESSMRTGLLADARPYLTLPRLRHMPGQHDQSTHGHGGGAEMRQSLRDAKTVDDLERVAATELRTITGRDIPVDLGGMDADVARHHLEGTLRVMERYPDAKLRGIRTFGPGSAVGHSTFADPNGRTQDYSKAYAVTVSNPGKGSHIYFNTKFDAHSYAESVAQDSASRHLAGASGDLYRIGYHETGHVVANSMRPRTIIDHAEDTAANAALDEGASSVRPVVFLRLGSYATTNGGELFAEAMSDVMSRGEHASDLSRAIVAGADDNFEQWSY